MSMEPTLVTLLRTLCPAVHADFAPPATAAPYITYQHIGGTPLRFIDGAATSLRHTMLQVNVWHSTRAGALALARQVEDAICLTSAWSAEPSNEPTGQAEPDLRLYGCQQDFDIWAGRT
jgi:hypothetical protein